VKRLIRAGRLCGRQNEDADIEKMARQSWGMGIDDQGNCANSTSAITRTA
jgi:hypothetical protein